MAVKKTTSGGRSTATKIDFMKATNDIGKPIAAVMGFGGGKYILNKVMKSPTVSGLLGNDMKGYAAPAALALGALVGQQFTKNEYVKMGLYGAAGAGVESIIKKATGKTILQGLSGLMGDDIEDVEYEDVTGLQVLNPITQALPAADIDIEREIEASVSGAASDYSMSDDPVGGAAADYAMSDEPIGTSDYQEDEEPQIGKIKEVDPDSMDYDIFSGDMMAS